MIEPEMAFYDLEDNIKLAEEFIKSVTAQVMDRCSEDLRFFGKWVDKTLHSRLGQVLKETFEVIEYTEAISILKKSSAIFDFPTEWGMDLQTEHERYLTEEYFKKPVFVVNYPKGIKSFYMRRNDDGKNRCRNGSPGAEDRGDYRRQSAGKSGWRSLRKQSQKKIWTNRPTGGTWTAAVSEPLRMQDSVWDLTGFCCI